MLMKHNLDVYNRLVDALKVNNRACIVTTMGTGKSYLTLEYLKNTNSKALIVCPRLTICSEWEKLSEKMGRKVGYNFRVDTITYHSFVKLKDKSGYDCYVFDEVHHAGSRTWQPAIETFMDSTDKVVIGLTADPKRYSDGGKDMCEVLFDCNEVKGYSMAKAIEKGILPPVTYICTLYDVGSYTKEYQKKNIDGKLLKKLDFCEKNCLKVRDILLNNLPKGKRKCVVFTDSVSRIEEAEQVILNVYPNADITSIHSRKPMSENQSIIEDFRKKDEGFLITVDMLNEGIHIKGVNTVIMFRRTESPTIYFQQIGRGMSAKSDERIIVFDFVGNNVNLKTASTRSEDVRLFLTTVVGGVSDQIIIKDYTKDMLDILDEIHKSISGIWSEVEDTILRKYYPSEGTAVFKRLDGRTRVACGQRAKQLGIPNNSMCKWSKEDDEILIKYYAKEGTKVGERYNPPRTPAQLASRAHILGVSCANKWSEEELSILREYYPIEGMLVEKRLPNRSKSSIESKVRNLGIHRESRNWSKSEDAILKKYYPQEGGSVSARLKGRTNKECITRANYLGISYINKNAWSECEDNILREFYGKMTMQEISDKFLDNKSRFQIQKRIKALNLKNPNPSSRSWSLEEDNYLNENFGSMSVKNIALALGRSTASVYGRVTKLGLSK